MLLCEKYRHTVHCVDTAIPSGKESPSSNTHLLFIQAVFAGSIDMLSELASETDCVHVISTTALFIISSAVLYLQNKTPKRSTRLSKSSPVCSTMESSRINNGAFKVFFFLGHSIQGLPL